MEYLDNVTTTPITHDSWVTTDLPIPKREQRSIYKQLYSYKRHEEGKICTRRT